MSFPGGIVVKNLPANTGNTGDTGSVLGYGRSFGGEIGTHSGKNQRRLYLEPC